MYTILSVQKDQSRRSTSYIGWRTSQKYRCAILLHKTETTRSTWWRKFNIWVRVYQFSCCTVLTAHFPAFWLEFQPPGNSREIVNVSAFYSYRLRKDTRTKSANFLSCSSEAALSDIIKRSSIETVRPFAAPKVESRFFFFDKKVETKKVHRMCSFDNTSGSRVKVHQYFRSSKERPALAISHIIISHYPAFVLLRIKT